MIMWFLKGVDLYKKYEGIFNKTKFLLQTVSFQEIFKQNLILSTSCSPKNFYYNTILYK